MIPVPGTNRASTALKDATTSARYSRFGSSKKDGSTDSMAYPLSARQGAAAGVWRAQSRSRPVEYTSSMARIVSCSSATSS